MFVHHEHNTPKPTELDNIDPKRDSIKIDLHRLEDVELYYFDNVDKLVSINRATQHLYKTVR